MRGKCESYYKYKVIDPEGEVHYLKMVSDAKEKFNMPKASFYLVLNNTPNPKWKDYYIQKVRIQAFERVPIRIED